MKAKDRAAMEVLAQNNRSLIADLAAAEQTIAECNGTIAMQAHQLADKREELRRADDCIEEMHAVIERKNAIIHLMSFGDCDISPEESLPVKSRET